MNDIPERRRWFEEYCRRLDENAVVKPSKGKGRYPCPCCGYPTLESRGQYDICSLCGWEDDGQDDPHEKEVWGGPNHGYSLAAARVNFADHLTMYDRGQDTRAGGEDTPEIHEAKRRLMGAYEALRSSLEPEAAGPLWRLAKKAEDMLWKLTLKKMKDDGFL